MTDDDRDGDDGDGKPTDDAGTTDLEATDDADAPVADAEVLDELFATIEDRKATLPEGSYTASLFTHEKGKNAVLEKLGEETTELLLAAKDDDREDLAHEAADVVYHLLVLLAMEGATLDDLRAELRRRF